MTDVAIPEDNEPALPRSSSTLSSALRKSRPTPKHIVTTRIAKFAVPEDGSTRPDVMSPGPGSGSSSSTVPTKLHVTSTPWSKKLILTLDGGGIKGYSSLIILRALMEEIRRIETEELGPKATSSADTLRISRDSIPDNVYRPGQYLPSHYFDYIAGTSVGGLVAIMLGVLGMSVDECIAEFHRQNKAIPLTSDEHARLGVPAIDFPLLYRRNTWPTKRTRSFFDTFAKFSATATGKTTGADVRAAAGLPVAMAERELTTAGSTHSADSEFRKDSYQCQTLAWCTEVEAHRARRPYAFCTYKEDAGSDDESDGGAAAGDRLASVPEVAKAITAPATSAFKPFKLGSGQFVDGSKQIRDPTLEVVKEITSLLVPPSPGSHGPVEPAIDLLLSLGTDEHHAWFYEKLRFPWRNPRQHEQQQEQQEPTRSRSESLTSEEGRSFNHYHRFEVPAIRLGFRKKHFLKEIEEATDRFLTDKEQTEQIRRYARMLVERRKARAATARWETFALGARYFCFHEGCKDKEAGREFEGRGDFHEHLERRHALLKMAAKGLVGDVEAELDRGRRFGCS